MIVALILLAFFVDTSWDRVQQQEEEHDYLVSLQREFAATRAELEGSLAHRAVVADRVLNLLQQAQGETRAPDDSLFLWSAALSRQLEFDPPRALLEGRIPRTDRLIRGTFGRFRDVPFGLSRHPADWSGVLDDPVFEDVLAERWMRLELATSELRGVREQVEEIEGLIERRMRVVR